MQEQTQFEPFVDAIAVAGHLKVTRRQVLEMTRYGVIPGHPLGTGSKRRVWRYKLSEIEAAVRSSGTNPSPNYNLPERHDRYNQIGQSPHSQKRKL